MSEFTWKLGDIDEVVEEGGNKYIALRKISFNGKQEKVDIRTWYTNSNGEEKMAKGVGLSDEGAHNLTRLLVKHNYGDTKDVLEELKHRNDFISSLTSVLTEKDLEDVGVDITKIDPSEFYDPVKDFNLGDDE